MRNKSNIDHFFELVKQNPPLIEIDQVHQIITSPQAKARPKGKRNNLLKFTIMTTIFGLIISAVVFWPNVDNEMKKDNSEHQSNVQNFEITNTGSQAALALPSIDRAEIGMDSTDSNMKSLHSEVDIDPFFKEVFLTREQKDSVGTKVVTEKISQQSVELFPQVICAVAYEAPSLSKFEIDIYGDIELKNVRNSKVAPPKDCLWLSVKSDIGSSLSSGEYTFTDNGFNFRQPFTFSGAMIHNNFKHKFKGGVLTIKRDSLRITISYDLILDNDYRLEGQYEGEYICTYDEQNTHKKSKVDIYGKPSQHVAQNHIAIKTYQLAPVQPIDGSRFILKLSKDELKQIGFQVEDSILIYENRVDGFDYSFGKTMNRISGVDHYNNFEFERTRGIYSIKNKFNSYPVFKSDKYFSSVFSNGTIDRMDFELANDTLLPIILPDFFDCELEDIVWFVATDQLYDLLAVYHKPILDEFMRYKSIKKLRPELDLITYHSPFLVEESQLVQLSQSALKTLGFSFYADSLVYKGDYKQYQFAMSLSMNHSRIETFKYNEIPPNMQDRPIAVFATDDRGGPLFGSLGIFPLIYPRPNDLQEQLPLLIPIQIQINSWILHETKTVVFWFLPNEAFFKSVAGDIGTELQKEYNYVVAEDKSAIEKPQCKYFEECKNTLKVSNFKVYPNPANNVATVSFTLPEAVNGRITLIDLTGRERQVLQPTANYAAGSHQFEVDLSIVPSGIYLVALYADKGFQVQRLVVSR